MSSTTRCGDAIASNLALNSRWIAASPARFSSLGQNQNQATIGGGPRSLEFDFQRRLGGKLKCRCRRTFEDSLVDLKMEIWGLLLSGWASASRSAPSPGSARSFPHRVVGGNLEERRIRLAAVDIGQLRKSRPQIG